MSETLYQFCERVVVAGHIRNHAALNRDNFSECRDGFCRDWHETHSNTRAAHPAVEVLDSFDAWLGLKGCQAVADDNIYRLILDKLRELRAKRGV